MSKKNSIKASHERITPYFYWLSRLFESKARSKSLELSRIEDGDSILILAPPTEFYLSKLLELNPNGKNHLLYFSEQMKQRAERRLRGKYNYSINLCREERLPYSDHVFDHVFAYCYFDYLDPGGIEVVIWEIKRALKQGGNLLATYYSRPISHLEKISVFCTTKLAFLKGLRAIELEPVLNQSNFKSVTLLHYSQKGIPVDLVYAEK